DRRQALVLYELSRLVMQTGDPQTDLASAAMMLADTLHHDVLGIWIAQANDTMLRLRAGAGYGEVLPSDVPVAGDAALQGAVGEEGRAAPHRRRGAAPHRPGAARWTGAGAHRRGAGSRRLPARARARSRRPADAAGEGRARRAGLPRRHPSVHDRAAAAGFC